MHRILAAIAVIAGVAMFSLSAVSLEPVKAGASTYPEAVSAKKKCKRGYYYDRKRKKCYRRGSH